MRRWRTGILLSRLVLGLAGTLLVGCGSGVTPTVTVTLNITSATVLVNGTLQFLVNVSGANDTSVKWFVNDKEGGDINTVGSISTSGLYTAPAQLPNPATVTVKAVSNADPTKNATASITIDSGVRVSIAPTSATIGTGEHFQFVATVKGTSDTSVNWFVNDKQGGDINTVGSIDTTGLYTAPQAVPSPSTVTIKAVSVADPNHSASIGIGILAVKDPTLTFIHPTVAAQGALFEDIYVTGTDFISTTVVEANGTALSTNVFSPQLIRVRLPDSLLAVPATLDITVRRQAGSASPAQSLTVVPVRPALVGASPDSGTEGGAAFSFNVNGGYFGTATTPAVTVEFNGTPRAPAVSMTNSTRQLSVTIGPPAPDLATPGLYSVAVRNGAATEPAGAPQQVAVTNLAVQPSPSITPPGVLATLPVGSKPRAVAINTATGIAVVANHDSNDVTLIDLTTTTPSVVGSPIPVGTGPTGVAADNLRNIAVVVNNGGNSVSIVDLASKTVSATITQNIGNAPFSVGVNPLTGLALLAYQSTNNASILDLNTKQVIGTVTVSTGDNPQVAVESRLNWALVTPGGLGSLAIVDLGRRNVVAIASNGAVRSANVVTITTTEPHGLVAGQPVLVTGVTDPSFNGTHAVAASPAPTTSSFSYAQSGPDATSGAGSAVSADALANVAVNLGVRGVAINPETERAFLVDPTTTTLSFMSVLDQTVTGLALSAIGSVAAAVNPLADIGVIVNPNLNQLLVIDPRTPVVLATVNVGNGANAVAIDPGGNLAVVTNETSGDVSIVSLGGLRPLQVLEVSPNQTLTSASDLPLTVIGKGFVPGSLVRLDGVPLPPPSSVTDREITVSVPPALLAGPRRYALDVLNPGNVLSNVLGFTVVQAVDLTDTACTTPAPRGVAIYLDPDPTKDQAVVTNPGCNSISLVNLNSAAVTTLAVGKDPQGVAVISRLGKAVVTNRQDNTASIVDIVNQQVLSQTVSVGTEPTGVAINQESTVTVVTNTASNNVSIFSLEPLGSVTNIAADPRPLAVAIDSARNLAMVATGGTGTLQLLDLSQEPPTSVRFTGLQLPTDVTLDPVTGRFVVTSSLSNNLAVVDPVTQQISAVRAGINPTSIAYNYRSSTLVTANTASATATVMDFIDRRVRTVLGSNLAPRCFKPIIVGTPPQAQTPPCGVALHPRSNLAVFADGDNNRVLLVPLPR